VGAHRPNCISLIGMPGVGKSTVGILLAKALSMGFVDTDVLIQERERKSLRELLAERGTNGFLALEETHVLELDPSDRIVATGGSVVYSRRAMRHLKDWGPVIHLELPLDELRFRLDNLELRGVVRGPGQDLEGLYAERIPMYRDWADMEIQCSGMTHEAVVRAILERTDQA
jgi:shikimate kinase